jgi:hypothetical protein
MYDVQVCTYVYLFHGCKAAVSNMRKSKTRHFTPEQEQYNNLKKLRSLMDFNGGSCMTLGTRGGCLPWRETTWLDIPASSVPSEIFFSRAGKSRLHLQCPFTSLTSA